MEKQIYHTLAYDNLGTHKMKFAKTLTLKEAIHLGGTYCKENGLVYVSTYENFEIEEAEKELRLKLYGENELN